MSDKAPGVSVSLAVGRPEPLHEFLVAGLNLRMKDVRIAARGDLDPATLRSNEIELEYPPHSGRRIVIPEVDRAAWVGLERAREWLNPAQVPLVEAAFRVQWG